MVREGNHAGAEHDSVRSFGDSSKEHLGRGDHLPTCGVMFPAPELVVSEVVKKLDELEVALELEERVFADGMVGR